MPKHEPIKLDNCVFDLAHALLLFLSVSWFHISFERHNNTVNMAAERKGLRLEKGFYKVVEDGVPLERANYPSSHCTAAQTRQLKNSFYIFVFFDFLIF